MGGTKSPVPRSGTNVFRFAQFCFITEKYGRKYYFEREDTLHTAVWCTFFINTDIILIIHHLNSHSRSGCNELAFSLYISTSLNKWITKARVIVTLSRAIPYLRVIKGKCVQRRAISSVIINLTFCRLTPGFRLRWKYRRDTYWILNGHSPHRSSTSLRAVIMTAFGNSKYRNAQCPWLSKT